LAPLSPRNDPSLWSIRRSERQSVGNFARHTLAAYRQQS
jgi:hypothetical protein